MMPAQNQRLEARGTCPKSAKDRGCGVRHIGEILDELLDCYRVRFPEIDVTVVQEPMVVTV